MEYGDLVIVDVEKNPEDSNLSIEFSLQERTLHQLARACWGKIEKDDFFCFTLKNHINCLVMHREHAIKNLPKIFKSLPNIFYTDLPKQLFNKLIDAIICLQQGYIEALIWEKYCDSKVDCPVDIWDPSTAGLYSAGNFIDPSGHFNDLRWAKHFVADENQVLQRRFELACIYCFEEAIIDLWHTMKIKNDLPYDGHLISIKMNDYFTETACVWAFLLENRFDEFFLFRDNADDFYAVGLKKAFSNGHEYAVNFFWARCSDMFRDEFLQELQFNGELCYIAKRHYVGVVHFFYSLLSFKEKRELISYEGGYHISKIWCCLLHSRFSESILNDILTLPIPSNVFKCFFTKFFYKIKQLRIPADIEIFKAIWRKLSKKKQIEVISMDLNLAEIDHINVESHSLSFFLIKSLLEAIIQFLSYSKKEKKLLNNWQNSSKSVYQYNNVSDYNELLQFLLFILIDRNSKSKKILLRRDAVEFLEDFFMGTFFKVWIKMQIQNKQIEEKDINAVKYSLKVSLQILNQLVEGTKQIHCAGTKITDLDTYGAHITYSKKKRIHSKENCSDCQINVCTVEEIYTETKKQRMNTKYSS